MEEETDENKGGDTTSARGSPLLKAMVANFRDPCLDKILERLDSVLTEGTTYSKNAAMMRHQVSRPRDVLSHMVTSASGAKRVDIVSDAPRVW